MEDRRQFLIRALLTSAAFATGAVPAWAHRGEYPLGKFIDSAPYRELLAELSAIHGFDKRELTWLFSRVRIQPTIAELYERPPERWSYDRYRRRVINGRIIALGRAYLRKHRSLFDSIEAEYGVDGAVIAAILGVESRFGRNTGGFRVFDALNTLLATVPRREAFARDELVAFMLLCRDAGFEPLHIRGSYAGAMGAPQFVPSSYRRYAVDYDRDGRADLWRSTDDIVASVARYLQAHGWRLGAPIRVPVTADVDDHMVREWLDQGIKGDILVSTLLESGVAWAGDPVPIETDANVSLLTYRWEGDDRPVAAFANFRALLHYNRSVNYVLAVTDLAEALQANV